MQGPIERAIGQPKTVEDELNVCLERLGHSRDIAASLLRAAAEAEQRLSAFVVERAFNMDIHAYKEACSIQEDFRKSLTRIVNGNVYED